MLLEECVDTDKGTLPNVNGTGVKYTCDYYKHNAEKCGKHDNNADGKCCSCKPAGNTSFYHTVNCSKSV